MLRSKLLLSLVAIISVLPNGFFDESIFAIATTKK